MHTGSRQDIKKPCEVRSTGLRLSTVSGTSRLSLTVSLAATTTTTNHWTLLCPALPCPGPLSTGGCLPGPAAVSLGAASGFIIVLNMGQIQCHGFGTGGLFLFSKMSSSTFSPLFPLFDSCFPASLSLSGSRSVCFSLGPGGLWACG